MNTQENEFNQSSLEYLISAPNLSQQQKLGPANSKINSESICQQTKLAHKEEHLKAGQFIKSAIYGGLDGIIYSLIVILSGIASGTSPHHILALSVASVVVGGIDMALCDYISLKSEKQYIKSEEARQLFEVETKMEDQKNEMIQIYEKKGFTLEQGKRLADLLATNKQAMVNIMMLEELGLVKSDISEVKCAIVTLISFTIGGILPVLPYIVTAGIMQDKQQNHALLSILIGTFQLFSLGLAKARIMELDFKRTIIAGLGVLILGTVTTAVGYGIGLIFY